MGVRDFGSSGDGEFGSSGNVGFVVLGVQLMGSSWYREVR